MKRCPIVDEELFIIYSCLDIILDYAPGQKLSKILQLKNINFQKLHLIAQQDVLVVCVPSKRVTSDTLRYFF